MHTHRIRLAVAFVLAALLAVVIAAFVMSARGSSRRIGGLLSELELRFKEGTANSATSPPTMAIVKELLASDAGLNHLVKLDGQRDDFAFDPARRLVYWVANPSPSGSHAKSGIWSAGPGLGGHAGMGTQIHLHAVRVENDRLLVELETLESYPEMTRLKGRWPPKAGQRYEAVIELATLKNGYVTLAETSEYRVLER